MVHGLNNCKLSYAFQSNPIIHQDLVTQFWDKASINKEGANGECTLESTIQGRKVVSEQVIQEELQFRDQPGSPIEIPIDQIKEVLDRMGYEGTFPPTINKLLPPYWHFFLPTPSSYASLAGKEAYIRSLY